MRTKQLSWPLFTAQAWASYEDEKVGLDLEAQKLLRQAEPAYLRPINKLCESDLDEQRFDRALRTKISSATLASSCTTLCDSESPLMEESRLSPLELPPKKGSNWSRTFWWRLCTPYRILFFIVFLINLPWMIHMINLLGIAGKPTGNAVRTELNHVLTAVSMNLTASIAIRNEHVINMLFKIFVTHINPHRWSLRWRKRFAKVYHFGGIHSGCGVAAVVWYGIYSAVSTHDFMDSQWSTRDIAVVAMTITVWFFMCLLLIAAFPKVRAKLHNCFEWSHRFFGWSILLVFWAQTLTVCIFTSGRSFGRSLVQLPTFWALILMSVAVAYPWIIVRKVKVRCEPLSGHALRMHVEEDRIMQPCRVVAISHAPVKETHKFATIPSPGGKPGYSMVISRAGDWTAKIIDNPPSTIWIKGAPAWGVLRVATMFDPVVIVATGSGIGPCLGLFNGYPELNCRIVWQARAPRQQYGEDIMETVLRADRNALIVDTASKGRRDMLQMALEVYQESKAEAVIVISNTQGTYRVVRGLESRGIPAFGPIWDS